ncbi:MAG: hypothetical protein ACKOTB_06400 [Planctomycetia bacterium]
MKAEERLSLLKQVESVAALAGLKGEISDDGQCFVMGFDQGEGRSQRVFIRPSGSTPDGKMIVTISSPATLHKNGWFSGFTREHAVDLLRRNEGLFFARYGIQDGGPGSKDMMIVASSDVILDSLDATELRAHAYFVATAADEYETTTKTDKF